MEVVVWVEKEERLVHPYQDSKRVDKAFQEQMVLKGLGVWKEVFKSTFKALITLYTRIKFAIKMEIKPIVQLQAFHKFAYLLVAQQPLHLQR